MTIVVMSGMFKSSSSSLVLEFRSFIIFCASYGLCSISTLVFCVATLTLCTSSSCSKITCIEGHMSVMLAFIFFQILFLAFVNI